MQKYASDGTRLERTGWRDESISQRHRAWGYNCPAVDLDFLMVEYNFGKPVGLVEYKHHHSTAQPNLLHPTYRALTELANASGLPFIIAKYWPEIWCFRVLPVNDVAKKHFLMCEELSEMQFVTRLYRIRNMTISRELKQQLNTGTVPEQFRLSAQEKAA